MDSLAVRLINNIVVYPTIRVASHPGKLLMGVYGETDEYVEDTVLNRRSGEQGAPAGKGLVYASARDGADLEDMP